MGYDVSYHPVDLGFIFERIVPCLLRHKDLMPLVEEAIVRERVRYRAKAWALGAYHASLERGRTPSPIEPYVHLWGRPFFIVANTPDHVAEQIDAYLAASTVDEVDRIARDNLRRLELGGVAPSLPDGMPDRDSLFATVAPEIAALVDVIAALRAGATEYRVPDGSVTNPAKLVRNNYPLIVLTFAARFRPGWMERGRVWPTCLMTEADLDTKPHFEPPWSLFPDALREQIGGTLHPAIHENYMVGGLVQESGVPALRALLRREQDALLAGPRENDWEDGARCALGKLDEALAYAERDHLAFAEATEVYSAPAGIVN